MMLRRTLLVGALVGRRIPGHPVIRGLLFGLLMAIVASPGLTPRRVSTFALFVPWFVLYGVAMSVFETPARRQANLPKES